MAGLLQRRYMDQPGRLSRYDCCPCSQLELSILILEVPGPEQSSPLDWDLEKGISGFKAEDLDIIKGPNLSQYRIIRYTPAMKISETETKYRIILWPSKKLKATVPESIALRVDPIKHTTFYTPHEVSRSLAQSFTLEEDVYPDHAASSSSVSSDPSGPVAPQEYTSPYQAVNLLARRLRPQGFAGSEGVGNGASNSRTPRKTFSHDENQLQRRSTSLTTSPAQESPTSVATLALRGHAVAMQRPKRRKTQHTAKDLVSSDEVKEDIL